MSNYCKAYSIAAFRQYPNWSENNANARLEKQTINGTEIEVPRKLSDDDFLYLHDNYVVCDSIFEDKNVIFDQVTPEWIKFCTEVLKFEVPKYE